MPESRPRPRVVIRNLETFDDLRKVEAVEREVWGLLDIDVLPLTMAIATREAGAIWIGAFDSDKLVGFAFGFLAREAGELAIHSHMLAVQAAYREHDLGYQLKLAQRDRAIALGIQLMTWTFDPLQSKNAHLNFAKLGVVSKSYRPDFYGPETSSVLHRNRTDRLWVTWPMSTRRVRERLQGRDQRHEWMDALSRLTPLLRFNGNGDPARTDLSSSLARQRIAIEIPGDIAALEEKNPALALEWRLETRWAFTEALNGGFFVSEFCRTIRGQQGPGAYLLEKGKVEEYIPELGDSSDSR